MSKTSSSIRDPHEPEGMSFVQDRAEIYKLLAHSSTTQCEVVLSFRGSNQKFAGVLEEMPRFSEQIRVDLGASEQLQAFQVADKQAKAAKTGECLVMVYSKRQYLIGLQCRVASAEGQIVSFEFPQRVFKLQRRKVLRWVLTGAYQVDVEMDVVDPTHLQGLRPIKHRLTDVSPGGISFFVEKREEAETFTQGMELKNITFILQGQKYEAHGSVRGVLPLPKNFHLQGYRVGVEFTEIDERYEERLERYVLIQSAYSLI